MLSELIALCPPPRRRIRVDWARAEGLLGVALPHDYKALVETYGPGCFSEWLWVQLPDSPDPGHDLLHDVQDLVLSHRSGRDNSPGTVHYAFHPEPSGLIRWGHTNRGDDFWWLPVTHDPTCWRIVASNHQAAWEECELTTSAFLCRLLTEQLELSPSDLAARILPWGDRRPHHAPSFRPRLGYEYDWDPRPKGLLSQPSPAAVREDWQSIVGAHAAGRAQPSSLAKTNSTGHRVPEDYLALLAEHGAGSYSSLTVAGIDELPGFGAHVAERQLRLRDGRRYVPAHFHPEPGGLIPWGELPGGATCCWYPAGRDPATWPVVICSPDGAGWQRYDLTTTAFLCEWLDRQIRPAYVTPRQAPLHERLDRLAELLGAGETRQLIDWPAVEAKLRVRLPDDYRAFVERFGAGSINEELYVDAPFAPTPYFDLVAAHAEWAEAIGPLHVEYPESTPYPPYPAPGGLLLCCQTPTRVSLSWRTESPDPNAWPLVLWLDTEWLDTGRGLVDILLDHLTGRDPLPSLIGFTPAWPPRWWPDT